MNTEWDEWPRAKYYDGLNGQKGITFCSFKVYTILVNLLSEKCEFTRLLVDAEYEIECLKYNEVFIVPDPRIQ